MLQKTLDIYLEEITATSSFGPPVLDQEESAQCWVSFKISLTFAAETMQATVLFFQS